MIRPALFAAAALAAASPAAALTPVAAKGLADAQFAKTWPQLKALYEDIHAHPELGFQETRTAARLAAEMRSLGFTVTEHVGGTGVVAVLANGPGPVVLVRTELDALPLEEKTGLAYASRAKAVSNGRESFVDHACGHDIHMAAWLGTAQTLLAAKAQWRGTLVFIAQPAEEVLGGAKAMLDDGLFTRFPKPDMGFGLHVGPTAYDEVGLKTGVAYSASDNLIITFKGRGGHGAMPDRTIDPVLMASRFVVDVQSLVSREKEPAAFGVVTVGALQAGTVGNIIPDEAVVRLTIRSVDPATRKLLRDGVERMARASAAAAGAPEPGVVADHSTAALVNDPAMAARTGAAFTAAFGSKARLEPAYGEFTRASEDFAYFVDAGLRSTYFGIGGYAPAKVAAAKASHTTLPGNHSPQFAPEPEPAIRMGMEAMTVALMSALKPA